MSIEDGRPHEIRIVELDDAVAIPDSSHFVASSRPDLSSRKRKHPSRMQPKDNFQFFLQLVDDCSDEDDSLSMLNSTSDNSPEVAVCVPSFSPVAECDIATSLDRSLNSQPPSLSD